MAPELTVVIAVWDEHTRLLQRCLNAIERESLPVQIIIVDNASTRPLDELPPGSQRITLETRQSIGAARNAGLSRVNTPYVVFADADDEIAPGALARSLNLMHAHPHAAGVVGRSIVDEDGRYRRGRTPRSAFRVASHYAPSIAPLFWLAAFQCSITSTVLDTALVRAASGFPDTSVAEDWKLAARLARRGHLICLDNPVRIYHRHPHAARNASVHRPRRTRDTICADCFADPSAPTSHRLVASLLRFCPATSPWRASHRSPDHNHAAQPAP